MITSNNKNVTVTRTSNFAAQPRSYFKSQEMKNFKAECPISLPFCVCVWFSNVDGIFPERVSRTEKECSEIRGRGADKYILWWPHRPSNIIHHLCPRDNPQQTRGQQNISTCPQESEWRFNSTHEEDMPLSQKPKWNKTNKNTMWTVKTRKSKKERENKPLHFPPHVHPCLIFPSNQTN